MKRVNFRRGLFRVWVILSCLWVIMVCDISFDQVQREFAKAAAWTPPKVARPSQAHDSGDWRDDPKTLPLCAPDKFGRIPMDCVPDADIAVYDAAAAHPWRTVLEMIAWATAPPIGMFILGLSCLWAIAGFTRTESAESIKGQA